MKGKRYPEEQIIGILREVESGVSVAEQVPRDGCIGGEAAAGAGG